MWARKSSSAIAAPKIPLPSHSFPFSLSLTPLSLSLSLLFVLFLCGGSDTRGRMTFEKTPTPGLVCILDQHDLSYFRCSAPLTFRISPTHTEREREREKERDLEARIPLYTFFLLCRFFFLSFSFLFPLRVFSRKGLLFVCPSHFFLHHQQLHHHHPPSSPRLAPIYPKLTS